MSKVGLYIIFFTIGSLNVDAQSIAKSKIIETPMQKCIASLFFNIWEEKADSAILPFLKKYVPILYKKPIIGGEWTIYPPDSIINLKIKPVEHSFIFEKHPYFDKKFREGILVFRLNEMDGFSSSVHETKLEFIFDLKKDADSAYAYLIDRFSKMCTRKKVSTKGESIKSEFIDKGIQSGPNGLSLILRKENNFEKRYVITLKENFHLDINNF